MRDKRTLSVVLGCAVVAMLCLGVVLVGSLALQQIGPSLPEALLGPNDAAEATSAPPTDTPLGAQVDLETLFTPFWEGWQLLHEYYVRQPLDDTMMMQGAQEGLTESLRQAGVDPETVSIPSNVQPAETLSAQAQTPDGLRQLFVPFWQTWQAVYTLEPRESLSYEGLMRAALQGMVETLDDPHTAYMTPYEYLQVNSSLEGEYEGIGAWMDATGDYLTVVAPMEGSPAEAAGLQPGDVVIAVDGEDMTGVDGELVIQRVLGPEGTQVVLTIRREGVAEPFDVTLTRARITVPSVIGEMLDEDIAYVQLTTFGSDTANELRATLNDLLGQDPIGLILDIRNNGGGYLDTAVQITSEFLTQGVVLYEEYGDGTRDTHSVLEGGVAIEIPLIVLVNEGSASASEILAGAIQDYGRGLLVGQTTFGKGSVQLPIALSNNQGALRITVARWLTPNERDISAQGLQPDVMVDLTEDDFEAGQDPQLDKAVELLLDLTGVTVNN
jgi:carboxyl-terminal processing protease